MKVIVCLGNPGSKYEKTRHNVGFRVGAAFVSHHGFEKIGQKFKSIIYEGVVGAEKVWVVFPQTYMNLSGEVVQLIQGFYKLDWTDFLIIYDDFDTAFGALRFRAKGSAGTHNGMRSIVQLTGQTDIARLRVGIGPKPSGVDVSGYVLSAFSSEEESVLPSILDESADVATLFLKDLDLAVSQGSRTIVTGQ